MKKIFCPLADPVITMVRKVRSATSCAIVRLSGALASTRGDIDTAIKILIAVVLGALLLAGLYTLFGDTVLPTVTQRVEEMFNYNG